MFFSGKTLYRKTVPTDDYAEQKGYFNIVRNKYLFNTQKGVKSLGNHKIFASTDQIREKIAYFT